jgi:RNA polymerase sigma-70 factor (ECF subfamily)
MGARDRDIVAAAHRRDPGRMTAPNESLISELKVARERFLELVSELRPDLHRYCARMVGSVADGEDIVQETLARAYYELSGLRELPALRGWLFRIAHNRALDVLRRPGRGVSERVEDFGDTLVDDAANPDAEQARVEAVQTAISRFLELAPLQRSCVILKDVLGYSLEEIAALLEVSVAAIKSALHRGRVRLRELGAEPVGASAPRQFSPALVRYAALFNARDWDGVRAMLVDDVKLELVSLTRRSGRDGVGGYFTNYSRWHGWRFAPGWLDGREVLAVFTGAGGVQPRYFVEVTLRGEGVALIRDFYHVPYIGTDARIEGVE